MNKKGFTVAEVLITLGIVGVIAAITIPGITESSQKKVLANSLSAAVSDFETAMTTMLMREGYDSLLNTPAWKSNFLTNLQDVLPHETDNIGSLARQTMKATEGDELDGEYEFFANNNALYAITLKTSESTLKESDIMYKGGALVSVAADVYIDVNGPKKPNMWGRDTFYYVLGTDGHLYPYGGKDWEIYQEAASTAEPEGDSGTEELSRKEKCITGTDDKYCAAYLAENGYNMDY